MIANIKNRRQVKYLDNIIEELEKSIEDNNSLREKAELEAVLSQAKLQKIQYLELIRNNKFIYLANVLIFIVITAVLHALNII